MNPQGTIKAFQSILTSFTFSQPESFSEEFAQKRFLKKMEKPDPSNAERRKEECWSRFKLTDDGLPDNVCLPHSSWYKAREMLHRALIGYNFRNLAFYDLPKGSEEVATHGYNSVESRLRKSTWTCTRDAFDDFCQIAYNTRALKVAAKEKYKRWYQNGNFDVSRRLADAYLYRRFRNHRHPAFAIFKWKLSRVVKIVHGSRFGTVPKNNEKDRPINVEPFGNLVVQRSLAGVLRRVLKEQFGADLDRLQDVHKRRLVDKTIATIDLKDASDSVSQALCSFMLPKQLIDALKRSRSPMIYGPDHNYYLLKKISSMGNGFTFELMSLILTSLVRSFDSRSSVYGDDIIVGKSNALNVVSALECVGFKVNLEKSFLDGPFRESCGGNFHDLEGYIPSFDFLYPITVSDCCLIYNKAVLLSRNYPSFQNLRDALTRHIPKALRGGAVIDSVVTDRRSWEQTAQLDTYFMCSAAVPVPDNLKGLVREVAKSYQWNVSDVRTFIGFTWEPKLASPSLKDLKAHQKAKYFSYLHAGRIAKDTITGEGRWLSVNFVEYEGRVYRLSAFRP